MEQPRHLSISSVDPMKGGRAEITQAKNTGIRILYTIISFTLSVSVHWGNQRPKKIANGAGLNSAQKSPLFGLRVQGLGFRVQGSGPCFKTHNLVIHDPLQRTKPTKSAGRARITWRWRVVIT